MSTTPLPQISDVQQPALQPSLSFLLPSSHASSVVTVEPGTRAIANVGPESAHTCTLYG
jgi:hypothetical protein